MGCSHFGIGYDYFLRTCFLVAWSPVRDLLGCAKYLFVAAMVAIVLAEAQGRAMKACSANTLAQMSKFLA
jgi:hypothetical protein